MALVSGVKFFCFEIIAVARLQNVETLPSELGEDLRKAGNDP
jgi:hypothetical protein